MWILLSPSQTTMPLGCLSHGSPNWLLWAPVLWMLHPYIPHLHPMDGPYAHSHWCQNLWAWERPQYLTTSLGKQKRLSAPAQCAAGSREVISGLWKMLNITNCQQNANSKPQRDITSHLSELLFSKGQERSFCKDMEKGKWWDVNCCSHSVKQ